MKLAAPDFTHAQRNNYNYSCLSGWNASMVPRLFANLKMSRSKWAALHLAPFFQHRVLFTLCICIAFFCGRFSSRGTVLSTAGEP
jgi:hypothetical protein